MGRRNFRGAGRGRRRLRRARLAVPRLRRITAGAGLALDQITGPKSGAAVGPRESFLVVALIWLLVPVFGALPFLLGDVPQLSSPVDAYFEAVSGFTATGATVLPDVEALGRAMLFWRQFTHWLGGMGIIILAVAILPRLRIGGRRLLESELAGPTEIERFDETIRETARRLGSSTPVSPSSRSWRWRCWAGPASIPP